MKIAILGAGEVGFHLAKTLAQENHDIVVVESNPERVALVQEQIDCLAYHGNATSPELLIQAEVGAVDTMIAVTSVDEVNILACTIGRVLGAKTRIARVRNVEFTRRNDLVPPSQLGVDLFIHPEQEAAREIVRLLRHGYAFEHMVFEEGKVHVAGVMPTEDSPVLGKTLAELGEIYKEFAFRVVAIDRNGETISPTGGASIELGDRVYMVALSKHVSKIGEMAGIPVQPCKNVMILGAGLVGIQVARDLEGDRKCNIKLIESSRTKSEEAADLLKETMVVRGMAADVDLLAQEGVDEMDAFIAATDDDEHNVVCSLVARHLQVPRVVTLVSKWEYLPIIKTIGLEAAVNLHRLTSNAILKYIRKGRQIVSVAGTKGIPAEAIEFQVAETSVLSGKRLEEIEFPRGVVIGAHVRGAKVTIATGKTELKPMDRIILFTLPDAVDAVMDMFS